MRASNVSQLTTTIVPHQPLAHAVIHLSRLSVAVFLCVMLSACATKPLIPYSADTPPLILVPVIHADVQDKRALPRNLLRRAGGACP